MGWELFAIPDGLSADGLLQAELLSLALLAALPPLVIEGKLSPSEVLQYYRPALLVLAAIALTPFSPGSGFYLMVIAIAWAITSLGRQVVSWEIRERQATILLAVEPKPSPENKPLGERVGERLVLQFQRTAKSKELEELKGQIASLEVELDELEESGQSNAKTDVKRILEQDLKEKRQLATALQAELDQMDKRLGSSASSSSDESD